MKKFININDTDAFFKKHWPIIDKVLIFYASLMCLQCLISIILPVIDKYYKKQITECH